MGKDTRPNFLLIVADDMGYSDLGCTGAEIQTPNIDRLAKEGMLFTDFHSAAACSPTRAMLFSGTDSHLSGLGVMAEGRSGAVGSWYAPGYEGYLNWDVAALPEILKDGGYYNLLSGKWHLGFKPDSGPHVRGFHRSLALLPGQTNHWAYHPELDKPNAFFARMPILHTVDGKRKIFPTNTENDYEKGYYSTNCYTDNLIDYLEERSPEEKAKPFFAALTYATPHWPLQCSKEDRDKYKGMYDDGPSALRARRLAKMKQLGIIGKDVIPHEEYTSLADGRPYIQWEQMSAEQKAKSARAMETYAGMVDCIDRNVGKVMDYLEKIGEADNTFVCFMSDNGSEGAAIEAWGAGLGDDILRIAHKFFSNKLENIGNHDSFVWYGPRWAQASTAPSKLYKGYSTEGGIRVPFVLRYPKGWKQKDQMIRGFSTVMDLAPTILDLAGMKHPVSAGKIKGKFHGREVYGMRGRSWCPAFKRGGFEDDVEAFHGSENFVGWELNGKAALRKGNWKITYLGKNAYGDDKWELYDLSIDPGERIDVSQTNLLKYAELLKDWDTYVKETNTLWGPDKLKGDHPGNGAFAGCPPDSIGGDPVEQCTAWMDVGEGQVAKDTLPDYSKIPGIEPYQTATSSPGSSAKCSLQ